MFLIIFIYFNTIYLLYRINIAKTIIYHRFPHRAHKITQIANQSNISVLWNPARTYQSIDPIYQPNKQIYPFITPLTGTSIHSCINPFKSSLATLIAFCPFLFLKFGSAPCSNNSNTIALTLLSSFDDN